MAQVAWSDVACLFDDLHGEVWTIQVENVGIDEWQTLLDLVRSRGWRYDYSENGIERRLPNAPRILEVAKVRAPILHFWPEPDLRIRGRVF